MTDETIVIDTPEAIEHAAQSTRRHIMATIDRIPLGNPTAQAHYEASSLPQTAEWVAVVKAEAGYIMNRLGGRWSDCVAEAVRWLEAGDVSSPMARALMEDEVTA